MGRFARGNIRVTSADAQEKYKQYCQHVFDLQNKVLASSEQLSTDEGTDNEDSDNEDMASRLEKMLDTNKLGKGRGKIASSVNKKAVELEDEEKDLLALQRMIHGDAAAEKIDKKAEVSKGMEWKILKIYFTFLDTVTKQSNLPTDGNAIRKLRIHRVFKNPDGSRTVGYFIVSFNLSIF